MILKEAFLEDHSLASGKDRRLYLAQMIEQDRIKSSHMIMKNEKASIG